MKFLFLGDLFVADIGPRIDERLSSFVQSHDIKCVNLEGVFSAGETPIRKAGPHLALGPAVSGVLEQFEINLLTTANNHFGDFGANAATRTLEKLDLDAVGYCVDGQIPASSYKDEFGQTITLVCACESFFGVLGDEPAQSEPNCAAGAWSLLSDKFRRLIRDCVERGEIVVCVAHCGYEGLSVPLPQWRTFFRKVIDLGAAAVVAHHPHSVQPCEVYGGAPIFYSIGNCYMSSPAGTAVQSGLAVTLESGVGGVVAFEAHPIVFKSDRNRLELDPASSVGARFQWEADYEDLLRSELLKAFNNELSPGLLDAVNGVGLRPTWRDVLQVARSRLARRYVTRHPEAVAQRELFLLHLFKIESNAWAFEQALQMRAFG